MFLLQLLQVSVVRSGPLLNNGYDWTITFLTDPGDLSQLVPTYATGTTSYFVPSVTVYTYRPGTVNQMCVRA